MGTGLNNGSGNDVTAPIVLCDRDQNWFEHVAILQQIGTCLNNEMGDDVTAPIVLFVTVTRTGLNMYQWLYILEPV
jgi:hypothetical protein